MTNRVYAPREAKAIKIIRVLSDFLETQDLGELCCLDLGCGDGLIAKSLAKFFKNTVAMEYDYTRIRDANHFSLVPFVQFLQGDGAQLPFEAATFDVVVFAQVYEHVLDAGRLPEQLVAEIWRVLRPGGVCFFSGPNKLSIMEDHYHLPFLSWVPKNVANKYMQLFSRGERYDIAPRTYWQLRKLWRNFEIYDYTISLLRYPQKYDLELEMGKLLWFKWVPIPVLWLLTSFLPNYNWVLRRRD